MSYAVLVRNALASKEIFEAVKNSRLFKNLKIGEILRDGKNVSEVKINSDLQTVSESVSIASNNSSTLNGVGSSTLSVPNVVGGSLAKSFVDSLSVSKSISTNLKALVEQIEITNQILASSLTNNSDLLGSINTCLVSIGSEIKAIRDFQVEAEYIKTPLSILQLEKTQFEVDGTVENGVKLKNSEGEDIIPMREKAKNDSENYIASRDKNNMDYLGVEDLFDDTLDENGIDINIMEKVLENILNYDTSKDVSGEVML